MRFLRIASLVVRLLSDIARHKKTATNRLRLATGYTQAPYQSPHDKDFARVTVTAALGTRSICVKVHMSQQKGGGESKQ